MDLSVLSDFNLVASHGGLGRASRASGRPKATLSRRIAELEESLGVRLVERGARSLRLTESGQTLYERTHALVGEITDIGAMLADGSARPRGRLRVTAPVLFSHIAMGRIAAGFIAAYPDIQLEVTAEDRTSDLIEDDYDVAIRINPPSDAALVGRRIARDELLVVASPTVQPPAPGPDPAQPIKVAAVTLSSLIHDGVWRIQEGDSVRLLQPNARIHLSSLPMIRDAVLAGAGAALLPRSMVGRDIAAGTLALWGRLAGAGEQSGVEIWVMHTSRRLTNAKVSAFVAYIAAAFRDGALEG